MINKIYSILYYFYPLFGVIAIYFLFLFLFIIYNLCRKFLCYKHNKFNRNDPRLQKLINNNSNSINDLKNDLISDTV
jgi:hypothetical protein